jgi:hypothetical protein
MVVDENQTDDDKSIDRADRYTRYAGCRIKLTEPKA